MACRSEPPRIAFGFSYRPALISYSLAGEPVWTSVIDNYAQTWFVEEMSPVGTPALRREIEYPKEQLAALHAMSPSYLVAVSRLQQSSEGRDTVWPTYLVDAATGWGALIGNLETMIMAINASRYVAYVQGSLYPRLQIQHLREGP